MSDSDLAAQTCEACRVDAPQLTADELQRLTDTLPQWTVIEADGVKQLQRVFVFKNFVDALDFTQKVGDLAEAHNHHPALLTEWGKVTVTWWTHKIGGLHKNDTIMAAKTSLLFNA